MSMGLFLLINVLVIAFLVRLIFSASRGPRPSGFNMDFGRKRTPQGVHPETGSATHMAPGAESSSERSLNCPFQYNGHTWDAFDALEVPAGSDCETCQRAYQKLRADPKRGEFVELAWSALKNYFES
jgi:hypothetical protein